MIKTVNETRLPNGLTILSDQMPGVRSVTLGFFFRIGARDEPESYHGVSHFIEHAVFKGTGKRTAFDLAVEQDRLGGNLEAYTTHEETGFAIKVIDENLAAAFDLIADMLTNPRFEEGDLKAEQKVIIEEMKMIEDSPEEYLGEVFSEALFPDHPLGRSIAGTPRSVRKFNQGRTSDYFNSVFNAKNLVIAAAGNVEHGQILELVSKYDFDRPTPQSNSQIIKSEPPRIAAPLLVKRSPMLEQVHLVLSTPFVSAMDERRYAGDMLTSVIGDGVSSRLWQKIREERGLAYSVGASAAMYRDCGVFSVFAATSPENVAEVVRLSTHEMADIATDGVSLDELDLAKQQARASILLGLEDSASRAAALAQSELVHGRQIPVEETIEKLTRVTPEDLRSLADEFFTGRQMAFGALGKLKQTAISADSLII